MIIYNVTINIEDSVEKEWLEYMIKTHIPDVMNTGCFQSYSVNKVLTRQDDETGGTYAIQYRCENMKDYEKYRAEFSAAMQKDHTDKFGGKFVAFRTLLEQIA